jgi:hypothetical protein
MQNTLVLAYQQAEVLLHARAARQPTAQVSPDLGLTSAEGELSAEGVHFASGQRLTWEQIEEIAATDVVCFAVHDDTLHRIQAFSTRLNRGYSLMPTSGAPTILIAGFPMHRIKDTDPYQDTLHKIRALGKLRGVVLDICTGPGYTAIEAARTASHVTTIEIDPTTLEIARYNPWSRELFDHPNIEQIIGDAAEEVQRFAEASFSRIIHDPPIFSLAGELYSGEFYRHLYRILKQNGRLFHYIGSPESKSGSGITRGVVRRLQQAGFQRVVRRPEAFGVVAYKN